MAEQKEYDSKNWLVQDGEHAEGCREIPKPFPFD